MGLGHGWWLACLPGWDEIDWPRFITALIEVNYKGKKTECEDDVFAAATPGSTSTQIQG